MMISKKELYSKFVNQVFIAVLSLYLCVSVAQSEERELVIGVHPYKAATELVEAFTPFSRYISKSINTKVSIVVSENYDTHIRKVADNIYDIAYLGPASYIKLVKKHGKRPLFVRLEINNKPTFKGKIFTRDSSDIQTIADLKGKRFAFGSKSSTMSYLVPKFVIEQTGLSLNDLGEFQFLGNHSNVALSVLIGDFDAGAVKEAVFEKYKSRGLRLITDTPEFSEHLFVASQNINRPVYEKIREVLLSMHHDHSGLNALKKIKKTITRLVPVEDSDYDNLREVIYSKK